MRTYFLSLFLRTFKPTICIGISSHRGCSARQAQRRSISRNRASVACRQQLRGVQAEDLHNHRGKGQQRPVKCAYWPRASISVYHQKRTRQEPKFWSRQERRNSHETSKCLDVVLRLVVGRDVFAIVEASVSPLTQCPVLCSMDRLHV